MLALEFHTYGMAIASTQYIENHEIDQFLISPMSPHQYRIGINNKLFDPTPYRITSPGPSPSFCALQHLSDGLRSKNQDGLDI